LEYQGSANVAALQNRAYEAILRQTRCINHGWGAVMLRFGMAAVNVAAMFAVCVLALVAAHAEIVVTS
jgi:hypothetical protein